MTSAIILMHLAEDDMSVFVVEFLAGACMGWLAGEVLKWLIRKWWP